MTSSSAVCRIEQHIVSSKDCALQLHKSQEFWSIPESCVIECPLYWSCLTCFLAVATDSWMPASCTRACLCSSPPTCCSQTGALWKSSKRVRFKSPSPLSRLQPSTNLGGVFKSTKVMLLHILASELWGGTQAGLYCVYVMILSCMIIICTTIENASSLLVIESV